MLAVAIAFTFLVVGGDEPGVVVDGCHLPYLVGLHVNDKPLLLDARMAPPPRASFSSTLWAGMNLCEQAHLNRAKAIEAVIIRTVNVMTNCMVGVAMWVALWRVRSTCLKR